VQDSDELDASETLDDFILEEEREIEAMALLAQSQASNDTQQIQDMSDYGSDDDDYDALMLAAAQEFEQDTFQSEKVFSQDSNMDMSQG
jgi:hypothetical protein